MMMRTVLCPIDFSELSLRELDLAIELCRAFGARLVVHHNLTDAGPGAGMRWMWLQERNGVTPDADAETALRAILADLPADVAPEAVITRGLAAPSILAVQERFAADLLLLGTHGATSDDHSSVTESVVAECRRPVLVLHESALRGEISFSPAGPRPWSILTPTDLLPDSLACVHYAFELAATFPIAVDLLHVVETGAEAPHGDARLRLETERTAALRAVVPPALADRVQCHVRFGDAAREIAIATDILDPQALVLGTHARGLLRRFLTSDTSRAVLLRTQCPTWVVPSRWAA